MRERHQLVASRVPPPGDLAQNPGMCPDQESNWRPSTLQNDAQSTEPHWSGRETGFLLSACQKGGNRSFTQGHLGVDSGLNQNGDDYLDQELGRTNA